MDPEEIARRELDRLEKKKRKQERRLLRAQNKLIPGDLFHTPGSDSDSGLSHVTDSEHNTAAHFDAGSQSSCDQTPPSLQTTNQNQRHLDRDAGGSELDSADAGHRSMCSGGSRASSLQKLNPFSVESLLSDARPRRTPAALPSSRPLIGKGHFLLYPITQPLGFIVPQTALKATNCDGGAESPEERNPAGARCSGSAGCRSGSPDSADATQTGSPEDKSSSPHSSPPRAFGGGKSTSVICGEFTNNEQLVPAADADSRDRLEDQQAESALCGSPAKLDSKEDVE